MNKLQAVTRAVNQIPGTKSLPVKCRNKRTLKSHRDGSTCCVLGGEQTQPKVCTSFISKYSKLHIATKNCATKASSIFPKSKSDPVSKKVMYFPVCYFVSAHTRQNLFIDLPFWKGLFFFSPYLLRELGWTGCYPVPFSSAASCPGQQRFCFLPGSEGSTHVFTCGYFSVRQFAGSF